MKKDGVSGRILRLCPEGIMDAVGWTYVCAVAGTDELMVWLMAYFRVH